MLTKNIHSRYILQYIIRTKYRIFDHFDQIYYTVVTVQVMYICMFVPKGALVDDFFCNLECRLIFNF